MCALVSKQFSSPSKMSLNSAIWIKTQYLSSNLRQNTITPGIVQKIVFNTFFLNKPILQLEYINSRMFVPLNSMKRTGNIYRSVIQCYRLQFPCFGIQSTKFCYQSQVSWSEYCVLMHADVFIDFKCEAKWNITYLRLIIMKKSN